MAYNGFIHIVDATNNIQGLNYNDLYKIEQTNHHIYHNKNHTVIESFKMNDINSANAMIHKLLSEYHVHGDYYNVNSFWIQLTCSHVQRIINRDENIMDVDLPFLQ